MNDEDLETQYEDQLREASRSDFANIKRSEYNYQRWLLDDEKEVSYLQNTLRGIIWNVATQQYEENYKYRIMNDKGARFLTETFLLPLIKNAKLTNHDEERIKRKMRRISKDLLRSLYENQEDFEIQYSQMGLIIRLFMEYIEDVYYRSYMGAEQERLSNTQKIISEERSNLSSVPIQDNERKRSVKDFMPF